MSLANITEHIIANGAAVFVKVSLNSDTPDTIIGLATNASYNVNYNLQDATVIGNFGPVSIDAQGYSCEITMGTFVPKKFKMGNETYDSRVTKGILEMLPGTQNFFETMKSRAFQSMEFCDTESEKTYAKFLGLMLSSKGITIEGNTYVRGNVQFRSLKDVDLV